MEEDSKELISVPITEEDVTFDPEMTPAKEAARKFIEGIAGGKKPALAAKEAGVTLRTINNSEEMKAEVEKLLKTHAIKGEIRKAMAQAGLNKMFMEAINSPLVKDRKLALDIAKQISVEEGVTMPEGSVTIGIENIVGIIKDVTLPGLDDERILPEAQRTDSIESQEILPGE